MKKWAITEIALGILVIAAYNCPCPLSNVVLGSFVVIFGGIILKRS